MNPSGGPPNLVVVVMDCMRSGSFPGTGGPEDHLPRLSELRKESIVFTRASTVAAWTLPSHASLFTGRYPWEHGVMGEGQLRFDPNCPTVGQLLRPLGYSSLALSANGMLAPLLSLDGAFDAYRWTNQWEKTFRWMASESLETGPDAETRSRRAVLHVLASALSRRKPPRAPSGGLRASPSELTLPQAVRQSRPEEIPFGPRAESATWAVVDLMNRVARVLRRPDEHLPLPIAPWIEGTLETWLSRQPSDRPVHCFINLLDAHEKYLSEGEIVRGLGAWIRFVRTPQNARLWLGGKWRPTEREFELLARLYERTIRILDRRIGAFVDALQRAGRWENTLFVITSDHGQAFGEHGDLFHERSPFRPVLEVPLWVRWPGGDGGGKVVDDPVSLTDIAPTLLAAAGAQIPGDLPGIPLGRESRKDRPTPVLAMADGFPCLEHYRGRLSEPAFARLLRSYAVSYTGDYKAVVGMHDWRCPAVQHRPRPGRANEPGRLRGAGRELRAPSCAGSRRPNPSRAARDDRRGARRTTPTMGLLSEQVRRRIH